MEINTKIGKINANLEKIAVCKNLSMAGTLVCGLTPVFINPNNELFDFTIGAGLIVSTFLTSMCFEQMMKMENELTRLEMLKEEKDNESIKTLKR